MTTLLWVFLILVLSVAFVFLVWKKKAGRRLFGAGGAAIDSFARNLANKNKLSQYQSAVDDATEELENARQELIQFKGLVLTVAQQVADDKKELVRLEGRINLHLDKGDETTAGTYADQYSRKEKDMSRNEGQLKQYDAQYDNTLKRIQYAKKQVDNAKLEARNLGSQLQTAKIQAKMAEIARGCNVSTGSLDSLNELKVGIQQEINSSLAVNVVDADLYSDDFRKIEEEEAVEKAEAVSALNKFKAKRNQQVI